MLVIGKQLRAELINTLTNPTYLSPSRKPASRHAPIPKHNPTAISCKRSEPWADARRGLLRLFRSGRKPNSMTNTPVIRVDLRWFMASILPQDEESRPMKRRAGHRKCHTEECGNQRTAGDVSHRLR